MVVKKKAKKKGRRRGTAKRTGGDSGQERKIVLTATRLLLGLVFLCLTVYTLWALVSYLFTWTSDQSLAFDPDLMKSDAPVANEGGKLGWLWADFLVNDLFGLGAFVLPVFMAAISISCFRIRTVNLLRIFISCLFGAVLSSVLFAYLFRVLPLEDFLGGSAGGSYGHYADLWLDDKLGVGEGLVLLVSAVLFLFLIRPKISCWFDNLLYSVTHRPKVVPEGPEADDEPASGFRPDVTADDDVEDDKPSFNNLTQNDAADDGPAVDLVVDGALKNPLDESGDEDEDSQNYDPRLDLPHYELPSTSLLYDYRDKWYDVTREELEKNKQRIVDALDSYKIKVTRITARMGPTVTLYKIHLADGVKIAQVRRLEEDIAISLGAKGVRVVTLLDSVGIEVANERPSVVALKAILNSPQFKEARMELPLAMGITVTNEPFFLDLAKMPHLLVAGATGMGKSVGLNAIIASLLYTKHPAEMKLVLVDPKKVELSLYSKLEKHFLAALPDAEDAIITDTKKVVNTLKSLCNEMESRYDLLKAADVRQIKEYNELFLSRRLNPNNGHKFLPYIVVIIDEFADLLMTAGREIEEPIARLAQKARAVGIHLVIATQRPTTDIITGTIKANFNSRIAFKVNSSVDSKTIIDTTGANRLIGRGDMLVIHPGADLTRVQCALIDTDEIKSIVKFIGDQRGYTMPFQLPEYVEESEEGTQIAATDLHRRDACFEDAAKLVVQYQMGSTSMIQRKLGLGYARAGKIMDQLEAAGIVGPQEGSKSRTVLVTDFDSLDRIFESLNHI